MSAGVMGERRRVRWRWRRGVAHHYRCGRCPLPHFRLESTLERPPLAAGDKLSTVELDELKTRVSKILVEAGHRVVVFIDDIDRLDRREIHAILKLIKLSASFQNTAYVLAFDDEMVSASLGE